MARLDFTLTRHSQFQAFSFLTAFHFIYFSMGSLGQGSSGSELEDFSDYGDSEVIEYYSEEVLKSIISKKKKDEITVVHCNISSLPRRFNDLHTKLTSLQFEPDIIGLSETKITTKVNTFSGVGIVYKLV